MEKDRSKKLLVSFCMCRDSDGKVTPEEVASAAIYLKDALGKDGIQELINNLSKDKGQLLIFHLSTMILMLLS